MRRGLRRVVMALAIAGILAVSAVPAVAGTGASHPRCPRGSHWVPPHRDKHGKWVQGHCRKS